ncbi:MAG: hypothetical protein LQ351_006935 [Letrouitia transgressa]|nr:MAG: hypothetical protein LQ351_006935 [Letrouitia transgressa]
MDNQASTAVGEKGDFSSRPASSDKKSSAADSNVLADLEDDQVESKPPIAGFDPSSFPDGGLQAWLVVSGAFCCLFCSFGWINCIGVFQAYYQTHQLRAYSPSTVAWIPSLTVFFMFAGVGLASLTEGHVD